MRLKSIKKLLTSSQLLKSNILNVKKYSFFFKKTNTSFSIYGYERLHEQLKLIIFILKNVHKKQGTVLFMGLDKKDHLDYRIFNSFLKNLVIKKGHIYADSKFNGFLYNRWSLNKRRSNPSDFFLNLQKNNKLPWVLISFSKETDNATLREFSKFGIPIIYVFEGYNHFEFKDYPILGSYSREMLNFYLNILKYCLK